MFGMRSMFSLLSSPRDGKILVGANFTDFITRSFVAGAIKTNKAVAKRFRIKGNGDLKRRRAGKSHNSGHKTRQRVNRLGTSTGVKGKEIEKRLRRMLNA
mmetsp:Transcript_11298/g.14751  ORF Transcript_11298/g.14751 Transcript_11298/m.14751 type:complete len:100 (-) Transcript_11298:500-799(-)